MADGHESERQIGFCDGQMDWQTDICNSRVAFATEKSWSLVFSLGCWIRTKTKMFHSRIMNAK